MRAQLRHPAGAVALRYEAFAEGVQPDQLAAQGDQRDFQNTVRVPSDVAGIALQNSINLPPILRKNQGEDVGIMVAQDFDFSDVYGVSAR